MPRAERPPVGSAQQSPSQILHHPERMVQAHGVLLVVAEPHGQIVQVSENLPVHLGWSLDDVIGHGVDRLGPELAHAVRHWAESPSLTLAIPRRVRLTTSTDSPTWFARLLLRLPFDFTIEQPVELREAVRQQAQRMLELVAR